MESWSFEDFSNADNLVLNGDSFFEDNFLKLTSNDFDQRGSVFYETPINITSESSFQSNFIFQISSDEEKVKNAEGFTFLLQNDEQGSNHLYVGNGINPNNLGAPGKMAQDADYSLAIEFDSFNNSKLNDVNDNHIAVIKNGDIKNPLIFKTPDFDLNSGAKIAVRIEYDSTDNILDIFAEEDSTEAADAIELEHLISLEIDLSSVVGSQAYVGFSASTGGRKQEHNILEWDFETLNSHESNPGVISLPETSFAIAEDSSFVSIPVSRTSGSDGTVSVDYSTGDSTAKAGQDFVSQAGTLIFEPGETLKYVEVPIINDNDDEPDETFSFSIGDEQGATLGFPRSALVTIADDDASVENNIEFEVSQIRVSESENFVDIALHRLGNLNENSSVLVTTDDLYAKAFKDYQPISERVIFSAGDTTQLVRVSLLDDSLPELNELFTLQLSDPVNTTVGAENKVEVRIDDDDPLPTTISEEIIFSNLGKPGKLEGPTSLAWITPTPEDSNSKMLIAMRGGTVYLAENEEIVATPIDLSSRFTIGQGDNINVQEGLLAIATNQHDFVNNPYLFLAYSVFEPDSEAFLVRVELDESTDYTTIVPNSETTLLQIPSVIKSAFHTTGDIKVGTDGSLFYSHGDAQSAVVGGTASETNLDNPQGFVLRINPLTGEGYPDNPFYQEDNPNSLQSKIVNYGLRNPWRFAIDPVTNVPYIGDVGSTGWEEINTGVGKNFGWKNYEGGNGISIPRFQNPANSIDEVEAPIYAQRHLEGAVAITMGDFYNGLSLPEIYQDSLVFADFGTGSVNALTFDTNGNVDSAIRLTESQPGLVYLETGADGNLYFTNLGKGIVGKWTST